MQNRNQLILLVITVVVIVCASVISSVRAPSKIKEKELLFPRLEASINDITKITLRGYNTTVELGRQGEQWVITSSGNYPAKFDKVRALLIQFANFRVLAEKTRRPRLYPRLSVEEPDQKGSRAIVTTLFDKDGNEAAALIIGKEKPGNAINPFPGFYGRVPDNETSLLIEGKPEVSAHSRDWFETSLFHIPSEKVREVRIQHPGEPLVLLERPEAGQPDFFLRNIPEGKKAQSLVIINRMGALLEDMVADDVRAPESVSWPDDTVTATVTTFDGLEITIRLVTLDDQPWASFSFNDLSPSVTNNESTKTDPSEQADARELNERHAGWIYMIRDFKYRDLTKHLDDLVRDRN